MANKQGEVNEENFATKINETKKKLAVLKNEHRFQAKTARKKWVPVTQQDKEYTRIRLCFIL
jgi:hypothetical protein